jgi:hypothetical protein
VIHPGTPSWSPQAHAQSHQSQERAKQRYGASNSSGASVLHGHGESAAPPPLRARERPGAALLLYGQTQARLRSVRRRKGIRRDKQLCAASKQAPRTRSVSDAYARLRAKG